MALRKLALGLTMVLFLALPLTAQEHGIARIDLETSRIEDFGANLHVELALSRPVPWRVFTLDTPRRLVVDFNEVDFEGTDLDAIAASDFVSSVVQRRTALKWSRVVIYLTDPMRIETAGLAAQDRAGAVLKLQLAPTTPTDFSDSAGLPEDSAATTRSAPRRLLAAMVRAVFGSARADEAG
jgi:N-acetylmuramoyl-L-alanine amidase